MVPYGYEQGYYVLCSCGWPQKQRKLYIFRNESTAKEKKLAEEGGAFLLAFGLGGVTPAESSELPVPSHPEN